MKAEWINPFIKAAEDVFVSYGLAFKIGKPKLQGPEVLGNDVNVTIGITGDIKGQVILSLGTAEALAVARTIVPWELTEFDEMASSSISELTNILVGRASTYFEQIGLATDLSVPSVFTGNSIKVYNTGVQNIAIPFTLSDNKASDTYSGFLAVSFQPA